MILSTKSTFVPFISCILQSTKEKPHSGASTHTTLGMPHFWCLWEEGKVIVTNFRVRINWYGNFYDSTWYKGMLPCQYRRPNKKRYISIHCTKPKIEHGAPNERYTLYSEHSIYNQAVKKHRKKRKGEGETCFYSVVHAANLLFILSPRCLYVQRDKKKNNKILLLY